MRAEIAERELRETRLVLKMLRESHSQMVDYYQNALKIAGNQESQEGQKSHESQEGQESQESHRVSNISQGEETSELSDDYRPRYGVDDAIYQMNQKFLTQCTFQYYINVDWNISRHIRDKPHDVDYDEYWTSTTIRDDTDQMIE